MRSANGNVNTRDKTKWDSKLKDSSNAGTGLVLSFPQFYQEPQIISGLSSADKSPSLMSRKKQSR